jgi:NADH-quinone oxidoreductase subunit H
MLVIAPPLLIVGVIPWGSRLGGEPCVIADLDVGLLYVLAVAPLTVYGLALAGWSSRSRYALLGGVRSSAQLIAYEICLAVGLLGVVLQCGSLNLGQIVGYQLQNGWLILYQPFGFLVCLVSLCAETNRLPFDMPEAEQELVAGYSTEYSSMKFGLFFMGEFASLIVAAALLVTLFLGGWSLPIAPFNAPATALWVGVAHVGIFLAKTFLVVFVFMWARWTFPRFRYDRVMRLGWTALLWVALANLVATAVVVTLTR